PPEKAGADFFPYGYVNAVPPRPMLASITNSIEQALAGGAPRGAIWLEGSPRVEDTLYWLSLVIDTDCAIVGTVAQRPNHRLAADSHQNLVDAVDFILSDAWRDAAGHNRVGSVLVQDQQVFAAREVIKIAPRPGGFSTEGGHGGVIGSTMGPTLTFLPNRRHGTTSQVRFSELPASVSGLRADAEGRVTAFTIATKDSSGQLRGETIPEVETIDLSDWMTAQSETGPVAMRAVDALVSRSLAESPLAGVVAESVQGGHFSAVEVAALEQLVRRGVPVVKVFRGATGSFVYPSAGNLLIEGSNLNASKARVLLMACLLRFGALPPAENPGNPTAAELAATREKIARYQEVFDTH
ncbi:MAG: hypothetical protein JWM35_2105, partial [Verrucomicrobia bacterium]|nr:hypothetical protein [Verrucomicrobiota bacterium]